MEQLKPPGLSRVTVASVIREERPVHTPERAVGTATLYSRMGTEHSHCGDALDLYGCWLLDSFFLQASQDSCQRTRDNACS